MATSQEFSWTTSSGTSKAWGSLSAEVTGDVDRVVIPASPGAAPIVSTLPEERPPLAGADGNVGLKSPHL